MTDTGAALSGLAEIPPGPQLAAALAQVSADQVPNGQILKLLRACSRQRAHAEAEFLAVVAEIGRRDPDGALDAVATLPALSRFAADETRATLAWSWRAARREHEFAEVLVHTLPAVHLALRVGLIDRTKAWVFADHLVGLPPEIIDQVCAQVLPEAGGLTPGQLAVRLARLIIEIDPERAEREYQRVTAHPALVHHLNADGSAVLAGHGLAPDESAAAHARVHRLAAAAARAGCPGGVDRLRTEVYLRLLDGRFQGLTHEQMIAQLLCTSEPVAEPAPGTDGERAGADTQAEGPPAEPTKRSSQPPSVGERAGVVVRVGLATVLGRDRRPGEIPGLGPILAPIARRLVARQHRARWLWAVVDQDGYLLSEGVLRRRPKTEQACSERPGTRRPGETRTVGGVVELHIPLALLTELAAEPPPGWARVIDEISRGHAAYDRAADLDAHPERRLPHAALRRHITIRDRTCTAPGCRHPAHHCAPDHTIDYADGGLTDSANLGPACTHHHYLKHRGGWRVYQPRPGHFTWISPLGGSYRTRVNRITDPDPPPG